VEIIKQHTEVLRKQQEWIVRHGDNASIHDLLPEALQFFIELGEKLTEEVIEKCIKQEDVCSCPGYNDLAKILSKVLVSYLEKEVSK